VGVENKTSGKNERSTPKTLVRKNIYYFSVLFISLLNAFFPDILVSNESAREVSFNNQSPP